MSIIKLRPAVEKDLEAFAEFCLSGEVSKFLTWSKYTDYSAIKDFFYNKVLKCQSFPNVYLMIVYENVVIGNAHIIARAENSLQIGIGLLPQYWNKGLGSMTILELEKYIKDNYPESFVELLADIHEENVAIRKILLNNKYVFRSAIGDHRHSFRKIISVDEKFDYIQWLKSNELVDSVVGVGSLNDDDLADIDILVVCYEESSIEELKKQTQYIEKLISCEKASCNHFFYSFENSRVYDVYFVSVAFISAVNNSKKMFFDKSCFISTVLKIDSKTDVSDLLLMFINNVSKLIYKTKEYKLEQATRILTDIRNKFIIPIGNSEGCLISQNIINLNWNDKTHLIYDVYMATFAAPLYDQIKLSVQKCLQLIQYLIEKYHFDDYTEKYGEISEYGKEFL